MGAQIERRFLPQAKVHLEDRQVGLPAIVGLAAVFYDPADPGTQYDWGMGIVERIAPTAFDEALTRGDDARGLFNHDPDNLLGRRSAETLRLQKVDRGLEYRIEPPDTELTRSVVAAIRRGDLTGSSFAFYVQSQTWTDEEDLTIRTINAVELFDVGPVTYPAFESTTTGIRACRPGAEPDGELQRSLAEFRERRLGELELLRRKTAMAALDGPAAGC